MGTEEINFPPQNPNNVTIFRNRLAEYITIGQDIQNQRSIVQFGNQPITIPDIAGNPTEVIAEPIPPNAKLLQGQCGLIPLTPGLKAMIGFGDKHEPQVSLVVSQDNDDVAILTTTRDNLRRESTQTTPITPKKLIIVGRNPDDPTFQVSDVPERTIRIKVQEIPHGHTGPVSSKIHMVATIVEVPKLISGLQIDRTQGGSTQYLRCLLVQNVGANPLYF